MAHMQAPNPWDLYQRVELPKTSGLENQELTSKAPKVPQETEIRLLKGSPAVSLAPESSKKAPISKAPGLYVKEIHLLAWGHLLGGQGTVGALSRDGGAGGHRL